MSIQKQMETGDDTEAGSARTVNSRKWEGTTLDGAQAEGSERPIGHRADVIHGTTPTTQLTYILSTSSSWTTSRYDLLHIALQQRNIPAIVMAQIATSTLRYSFKEDSSKWYGYRLL